MISDNGVDTLKAGTDLLKGRWDDYPPPKKKSPISQDLFSLSYLQHELTV